MYICKMRCTAYNSATFFTFFFTNIGISPLILKSVWDQSNENTAATVTRVKIMKIVQEFQPFFPLELLDFIPQMFITAKMCENVW